MQHTDLLIRQAVETDAPGILALIQEAMTVYIRNSGIQTSLDSLEEGLDEIRIHIRKNYVLVAENRDRIIGTVRLVMPSNTAHPAGLNGLLTDQPADLAVFSRFAVLPQLQQSGVGRLIYQAAEEYLASVGIRRIRLHTALSNPSLVDFYRARGFTLIQQESSRGYARGCFEKAIDHGHILLPEPPGLVRE